MHGNAAEILPLIFAEVNSSIRRLPDDKTIKFTAEQTRKEKQVEDSESQFTLQNPPERNQPSKYSLLTSESHPLRVDFIASEEFPILTKLGMTLAPGKKQMGAITGNWDRDLVSDLMRLRDEFQTETLVSLIEENELAERGIQDLEYECRIHGIELIRFPLRDVSVPASLKSFARLIREITKRLKQKKTVVIHCKGGLGRAGLTTACSVVAASDTKINSSEAIKMVRWTRKGAIETKEQENFVSLFGEYWQLYNEKTEDILRQQKTAIKEKVFEIGCEGGGLDLLRFNTGNGKWYFYTKGSSISLDKNDDEEWINWETDPVETIADAIDDFKLGSQIFMFYPLLLDPEHRMEVKEYLKTLYAALSDEEKMRLRYFDDVPITPEKWLSGVDVQTLQKAEQEDYWQQNSNIQKSEQNHRTSELKPAHQQSDKHFLLYWQEKSVRDHKATGYPLDVVSSRQLKRTHAGDTLWIVTINKVGELILAGRLRAREIVDYKTAVQRLNDISLWDGGFYALPRKDTTENLRWINLKDTALDLRFAHSESDRFVLKNGKINAQQLQTMRELTPKSAETLNGIWQTEKVFLRMT